CVGCASPTEAARGPSRRPPSGVFAVDSHPEPEGPMQDTERLSPIHAACPEPPPADFDDYWRREILQRVWEALARADPVSGAALRLKAERPRLRSAEIARLTRSRLQLSEAGVREALRRGRDRFAKLLIDEVGR